MGVVKLGKNLYFKRKNKPSKEKQKNLPVADLLLLYREFNLVFHSKFTWTFQLLSAAPETE